MGVIQNQIISPIDKRWVTSLENTFQQEKIRPKPIIKIRWEIKGKITNNRTVITLNFKIINRGNIITKPIRKLRKLAKTVDKGMNSRGKIACFNIEVLTINELVTSDKVLEKNIQGIIPERTNMV